MPSWVLANILILTIISASIYNDHYSHKKHKISQSQHSVDYLKEIKKKLIIAFWCIIIECRYGYEHRAVQSV